MVGRIAICGPLPYRGNRSNVHTRTQEEGLDEHGVIELTARDQKVFVRALLNPPKPNEKLRKAAKRYRMLVGAL
jgi:uncharacterized protein (DUF1778 family)